ARQMVPAADADTRRNAERAADPNDVVLVRAEIDERRHERHVRPVRHDRVLQFGSRRNDTLGCTQNGLEERPQQLVAKAFEVGEAANRIWYAIAGPLSQDRRTGVLG